MSAAVISLDAVRAELEGVELDPTEPYLVRAQVLIGQVQDMRPQSRIMDIGDAIADDPDDPGVLHNCLRKLVGRVQGAKTVDEVVCLLQAAACLGDALDILEPPDESMQVEPIGPEDGDEWGDVTSRLSALGWEGWCKPFELGRDRLPQRLIRQLIGRLSNFAMHRETRGERRQLAIDILVRLYR